MRVVSVVGARPQFVKLAPVAHALTDEGHEHVIVHTGQHYDERLSDVFFADLKIPDPDVHLGVGSGSHGVQTGAMLAALDPVLDSHRPDWVLVYGDTNSTLAGALSAVKMHIPLAHLEAGLRSFNRRMPEEHNRVLTDHTADVCLAPTERAMGNLATEGLASRSRLVGDVMADVCLRVRDAVAALPPPSELPSRATQSRDGYLICTIHRAENTDDPDRLAHILAALAGLRVPVVLLVHPRLAARAAESGLPLDSGAVIPIRPLSYPALISAVVHSRGVVTDSGGLQKEAYLLARPCTTLRTETEWTETLQGEWNMLRPDLAELTSDVALRVPSQPRVGTPFGQGRAAHVVVTALADAAGMKA